MIPRPVTIAPRFTGGMYRTVDNQADLLPRVRAARAAPGYAPPWLRRQAFANCDRAPFGWEAR